MRKVIIFTAVALTVTACGGGGGEGDPVGRYVSLTERNAATYANQAFQIRTSENSRDVGYACNEIEAESRESLEEQGINTVFDDGFCFGSNEVCLTLTGDNVVTAKNLFLRRNEVYPGDGLRALTNYEPSVFGGQGTISMVAGMSGSICTADSRVVIPTFEGTYDGVLYTPERNTTLGEQRLLASRTFAVECSAGFCDADNSVIEDFGGMNLNPSQGDGGPYLADNFTAPGADSDFQRYNFWGTATSDGRMIVGMGVPIGELSEGSGCYNNCVMLVYTKRAD